MFCEIKTWRFLFSQYWIPVFGGYTEKEKARMVVTGVLYRFMKRKKKKREREGKTISLS